MNKYGTILIVDDNASILTAMHYLLDDTFERVLTTTQPEEILKLMAQQPVDLVLLDMNFTLGVNNGNEGLFWLRTIRKQHPQTPVVLLTAYADVNLAVKGLKNGAADFITKPWDNDELTHKLKDAIDKAMFQDIIDVCGILFKQMQTCSPPAQEKTVGIDGKHLELFSQVVRILQD